MREKVLWLVLLAVACGSRLWDLGARVMTHDESLHAFYSLELLRRGQYIHDPTYHGPLLYHLNSLAFFLFGVTDATARLVPVLIGLGLIGVLWFYRSWLGRNGALFAGLLCTISPTLLFYSRHARNDIYIAFFALLWILGAFRYLEDRRRRWLYLMTVGMALAFITKEVSFILGATIGSFFVLLAFQRRRSDTGERSRSAGDVAVLLLTLVLPFAAGFGYVVLGWNVRDSHTAASMALRGSALVGSLFVLAALLTWLWIRWKERCGDSGGLRFGGWLRLAAVFWGLQVLFFTTLFNNLRGGLVSGIVGSLGYWLTQQEVARGSQPWFYYLMIGSLYEFLPFAVAGAALLAVLRRGARRGWTAVPVAELPQSVTSNDPQTLDLRRHFVLFLVWWGLFSIAAYTASGEKMPWLLTHIALPLCLLAGWALARLWASLAPWRGKSGLLLIGCGLLLPVLAIAVFSGGATSEIAVVASAETLELLLRFGVFFGVFALAIREARRVGLRRAGRLFSFGFLVLLGLLTVRTSLRLAYSTYDLPTELISYAQGSPDVKEAMREIEMVSKRSVGDRNIIVAYDDQSSWPFVWYLKDYPKSRTWGTSANLAEGAAVILVGPKNRDALWSRVAQGYVKREYRLIWWPRQGYLDATPATLWNLLRDGEARNRLWRVFMHRDYGDVDMVRWDPRQDFDMYVRADLAGLGFAGGLANGGGGDVAVGAVNQLALAPLQVLSGPFAGLDLLAPTDLAIAPDRSRVIADAGNHRIVVLESDGSLRLAFGSRCARLDDGTPGCVDPDGGGPLELGDGQLNEPWGVGVSESGEIYISDTWNHRVQAFDGRGRFLDKWGDFGSPSPESQGEPLFYGPRGIGIDPEGKIVVADTGNKRLLVFNQDGSLDRAIGSGGPGLDGFDEPVGIALDSNGTFLVADTWNRRIKRIDARSATLAAWRVPTSDSRDVPDKAFLAVDASGVIYLGDPATGRVLIFTAGGQLRASFVLPETEAGPPRPTGLAVDNAANQLLVVDNAGNRVLVYPLYSEEVVAEVSP